MELINLETRLNGVLDKKWQSTDTLFKPTSKSEETMKYFIKKISTCLEIDKDHANVFLIKDGEYLAKLLIRGYKDSDKGEKIGEFYQVLEDDIEFLLYLAIEYPNEKQILLSIFGRLAYGFVSKDEKVYKACLSFFFEVFVRLSHYYKKMRDYVKDGDGFGDTDGCDKNMSSPGFFQPNFVKKIDEVTPVIFGDDKSHTSFEDIP